MIVLLATGVVPSAVAGLLAAGALVLPAGRSRCEAAYRGDLVDDRRARGRDDPAVHRDDPDRRRGRASPTRSSAIVGELGPYALLAGLFVVTAVFGQLISNMATALIVIPIAIAAATELGVDVRPVLMSVTIAAVGGVPDARGHAREPDGDGSRRVPLRGLLEAGPAVPAP